MSLYLPLFKALNEADVQYVVVGGLATVLHGYARLTADIDLVINLEKAETEKVIQVLTGLGLKPKVPVDPMQFADPAIRQNWINEKGMLVFSFYDPAKPLLNVNLFVREPIPYAELAAHSEMIDLHGQSVRVCAIKDLIIMKKKAGRPKDLDDIKHLQEIQKIRQDDEASSDS